MIIFYSLLVGTFLFVTMLYMWYKQNTRRFDILSKITKKALDGQYVKHAYIYHNYHTTSSPTYINWKGIILPIGGGSHTEKRVLYDFVKSNVTTLDYSKSEVSGNKLRGIFDCKQHQKILNYFDAQKYILDTYNVDISTIHCECNEIIIKERNLVKCDVWIFDNIVSNKSELILADVLEKEFYVWNIFEFLIQIYLATSASFISVSYFWR